MAKIIQFPAQRYFDFSELFEHEEQELPVRENAAILYRAAQRFNEKIRLNPSDGAVYLRARAQETKNQRQK